MFGSSLVRDARPYYVTDGALGTNGSIWRRAVRVYHRWIYSESHDTDVHEPRAVKHIWKPLLAKLFTPVATFHLFSSLRRQNDILQPTDLIGRPLLISAARSRTLFLPADLCLAANFPPFLHSVNYSYYGVSPPLNVNAASEEHKDTPTPVFNAF